MSLAAGRYQGKTRPDLYVVTICIKVRFLVSANGDNPDPSSTHGKKPEEAKALELKVSPIRGIWPAGILALSPMVNSIGTEILRRSPVDWLTGMSLISAGGKAETDRYIGYMKPYARTHEALDEDRAFQEEVMNAARALGKAVSLHLRRET